MRQETFDERRTSAQPVGVRPWVAALVVGGLFLACGDTSSPSDPAAPSSSPSIVLISIDTLRADRLPAYGYRGVTTPAIDRLRRDALLFERAYSHAPLTMPAHASLFTGRLPAAHGVRDNLGYRFDAPEEATLAGALRARGYATGGAVSAYVLRGAAGFANGFDRYDDAIAVRPGAGLGGLQRPGPATLRAIDPWLAEAAADDRPFFLFVHVFEPHTPYTAPVAFARRGVDAYDDEIAAADAAVGTLLDRLRALGVYDESVIVLLSDHGEGLGDHGEDEHGLLLHREVLQVPLIVKLPHGARAGETVAVPAALIDVMPTLLALAGAPRAGDLPGRLLDQLRPEDPPRAIVAETFFPLLHFGWSPLFSVIEDERHLIAGPVDELYDLVADPGERHDLLRDRRREAVRLRAVVDAYETVLHEPGVVPVEERRRLQALGYLSSGAGSTRPGEDLPHPKARLSVVRDLRDGLRAYQNARPLQAVEAYERVVASSPEAREAWEYLARARAALGRVDGAIEAFDRACRLAGDPPYLTVSASLVLLNAGRPAEALAFIRRGLDAEPDRRLRLLEVRTLIQLGRLDAAHRGAATLAAERSDDADAVYLLGVVSLARGEIVEAEAALRRALTLAPDHTAAMSDLAVLLGRRGEIDAARALYERVLALRPDDVLATQNLRRLPAG